MLFNATPLEGNYLIQMEPRTDHRGFFARCFCEDEFAAHGLETQWAQISMSMNTHTATLRGLHFQIQPKSETKLVQCVKGAIWDVVVDLRQDSDTFGKWFGSELSEDNQTMMYIPKGFAHGFISLVPSSEILYFMSSPHSPKHERVMSWNDPQLSIDWPIVPSVISNRDQSGLSLSDVKRL